MCSAGGSGAMALGEYLHALPLTCQWFSVPAVKKAAAAAGYEQEEGNSNTSFTAVALEKGKYLDLVKWCSGQVFAAAVDTTVSTIQVFFLAMTLHQESQKRAQEEIDVVCGKERLPSLEDRARLPYIEALVKEVLRWQPVVPLAVPHRLMRDDGYKDMFLPEGSLVFGNSWAISRDPNLFDDADKFMPERYLPQDGRELPIDPLKFAFGYGRRICAGMHYADNMLFITMSRILATFNITPSLDDNGNEILPKIKFNSTILREVTSCSGVDQLMYCVKVRFSVV